ncbi:hypothetical protein C1645_376663 [Glomus cerebriforme]|uniref:Transmembrane protein n=1 Tax=Glomus cerebriforme TaxID=658196 RepID=A0A397TEN2_9GLOM|nr:hypothetical protein C1645_376663 [Glomus cerebriforme]
MSSRSIDLRFLSEDDERTSGTTRDFFVVDPLPTVSSSGPSLDFVFLFLAPVCCLSAFPWPFTLTGPAASSSGTTSALDFLTSSVCCFSVLRLFPRPLTVPRARPLPRTVVFVLFSLLSSELIPNSALSALLCFDFSTISFFFFW